MTDKMPDRRLHAYRPDLADSALRGMVEAERFVDGQMARVIVPIADMRPLPELSSGIDTQLLLGQSVAVYDIQADWAWCKAHRDGYVGYVRKDALDLDAMPLTTTHQVIVPRTFLYPEPDMKRPAGKQLSLGSQLTIIAETKTLESRYLLTKDGNAVFASHLAPIDKPQSDYVAIAETLLHTPYLWGGASAFGIDCSGLVQLCMHICGRSILRDSDMQASSIGTSLDDGHNLQRGDLVFWKGHVGIMVNAQTLIHANGHTMSVACEPLDAAVSRIGYLYGEPTGFRRP